MNHATLVTCYTIGLGVIVMIGLIPRAFGSEKMKRKFRALEDRELFYQYSIHQRLWRNLLIVQYAAPAILIVFTFFLPGSMNLFVILGPSAIIVYLVALAGRKAFATLKEITGAEIEYRKFRSEKIEKPEKI